MDTLPRALNRYRFAFTALLLLALLALQIALLVHHYEFDEHAEGELCQLCLHQSSNGKYLSSAPLISVALPALYLIEPVSDLKLPLSLHAFAYLARAPPLPFFS